MEFRLFGILAPIARLMRYKGSYDEYLAAEPSYIVDLDAFPGTSPDHLSPEEVERGLVSK